MRNGVSCLLHQYYIMVRWCAHITLTLKHLHWLPARLRVHFKIALFVYEALKGFAPLYLIELLQVRTPGRYALRTNNQLLLEVPRTRCKTFGDRAFTSTAPRIWNDLPIAVRERVVPLCRTNFHFPCEFEIAVLDCMYTLTWFLCISSHPAWSGCNSRFHLVFWFYCIMVKPSLS